MPAKSKRSKTVSRRNTIKLCDSRLKSMSLPDLQLPGTSKAKTKIKSGELVVAKHLFGPRLDYRLDVNRFINCIYLTPSSSVNSTESISVKLAQHLLKGEQLSADARARKSVEIRDIMRSDGKLAKEINL